MGRVLISPKPKPALKTLLRYPGGLESGRKAEHSEQSHSARYQQLTGSVGVLLLFFSLPDFSIFDVR